MEEKVFSVVEFNNIVKRIFDAEEYLHGILISGEVTNFKISNGHAYFNLKDEESQVNCTFFGLGYSNGSIIPKNGDKVICRGSPNYYVKGGSFSFNVKMIQQAGLGALYLQFIELKNKLEKEGIFAPEHKKAIPENIKRIGVVTSSTGAVIQDIINVSRRRNPFSDVVLWPVKVQGENAEFDIANGIKQLDKLGIVDVIIVGRGGGSQEDLLPFNTEVVARAVYDCVTPIISAVGHETDFSLCDFASDLRAPTPSAAAELATKDIISQAREFKILSKNFGNRATSKITEKINRFSRGVDKLKFIGQNTIVKGEKIVSESMNEIEKRVVQKYNNDFTKLQVLTATVDNKNPLKMLDKGFAKISLNGNAVKSIKEVKIDDELKTYILGGEIKSKVFEIKEN